MDSMIEPGDLVGSNTGRAPTATGSLFDGAQTCTVDPNETDEEREKRLHEFNRKVMAGEIGASLKARMKSLLLIGEAMAVASPIDVYQDFSRDFLANENRWRNPTKPVTGRPKDKGKKAKAKIAAKSRRINRRK